MVEIAPKTVGTTTPDSAPPSAPPRLGRNLAALAGGQIITWSMTLVWTLVVPRAAVIRDGDRRFVYLLEDGRARASLQEYPREHPLALVKGSDNIIAFTTKRYSRTPLIVQGPGAGADVTAMGVFSDILKLLHYLPE